MDYFIADTHFGHKKIIMFERKEFKSIEEHDNFLIDSINKRVKPTDTLYLLGDVGDLEKARMVNGRKILILGNHDNRSMGEYLGYFAEVERYPKYYSKRILLSHEPHPVEPGIINVHGHLHNAKLDLDNYISVSAHAIHYTPLSEKDLLKKLNDIPQVDRRFTYEWFAEHYRYYQYDPDSEMHVLKDDGSMRLDIEKTRELREGGN